MYMSHILIVLLRVSEICSNKEHYYFDFFDQKVTLIENPKFLKIGKYTFNIFGELSKVITKLRKNKELGKNTIDSGFIDKLETAVTQLSNSLIIPDKNDWKNYFYDKPPTDVASCHSDFKNAQLEISSLKVLLNMETPMEIGSRRKRQSAIVTDYLARYDRFFEEKNELSNLAFNEDAIALLTDIQKLDKLDFVAFKITGQALDQLGRTRKTQEKELIKIIRNRVEADRELSDTYKRTRNNLIATFNDPTPTTEQSNKRTREDEDDINTDSTKVPRNSLVQQDVRSDATSPPEVAYSSTDRSESPTDSADSMQKDLSYLAKQTLKLAEESDQNRVNDLASIINDLTDQLDDLIQIFSEGSLEEINQLCSTKFVGLRRKNHSTIVYTSQVTAASLRTIPFCSEFTCYQLERKHLALKLETGRFCLNGEIFTEDRWICKSKLQLNGPPCKMINYPTNECQFKSISRIGEELNVLNFGTAVLDKRTNTIYQNLGEEEIKVHGLILAPKLQAFQVGYNTNISFFLDVETITANFNAKDGYWNQILNKIKNSEHSDIIVNSGLALSIIGIVLFIVQALCYCLPQRTNLRQNAINLEENSQEMGPIRPNYQLVRFEDRQ